LFFFFYFLLYLVCDIIRSQDVPIGIRQTLTPVSTTNDQEQNRCFQNSRGRSGDHYMLMDEEGKILFNNNNNKLKIYS
jgi:hypothetical protein